MKPKNKIYWKIDWKKRELKDHEILVATTTILGIINLIILLGRLNIDSGEAIAGSVGSIFGFSVAILVLYAFIKVILYHIKGIETKLSKKEISVASLLVALLIYLILNIVSGRV